MPHTHKRLALSDREAADFCREAWRSHAGGEHCFPSTVCMQVHLQIPPKPLRTEGREAQRRRNPAPRGEGTRSEALSVVVPYIRDVFVVNCVDGYRGAQEATAPRL